VGVVGIDHVQLAAPPGCEEAARRFFSDVLGMSEVDMPAALRRRGGVWFRCGAQQLHVGVEDPHRPAHKAHPALLVDGGELEATAGRLADAGSPVDWDDSLHPIRRFHTRDPWGNRLELLEAVSPSGG
jgi:catechol 2,3-dioxygenase-like lactoylglutathione lyase family enzyme